MANNFSFSTMGATPHLPEGSNPQQQGGGTSYARALNGAPSVPLPPTMPLVPPTSSEKPALKSHSIQHPDGTIVKQEFHAPPKPESGVLGKEPLTNQEVRKETPMPEIKVINGMHHIPFKGPDGTVKFINAKGEIH